MKGNLIFIIIIFFIRAVLEITVIDIIPNLEDAQDKRKAHLIKLSYSSDEEEVQVAKKAKLLSKNQPSITKFFSKLIDFEYFEFYDSDFMK